MPAIVTGGSLLLVLIAGRLLHVHCRNRKMFQAFGRRQTDCAGFSQLQNLIKAQSDVAFYTAALAWVPVGIIAVHLWQMHLSAFHFTSGNTILIGLAGTAVTGFVMLKAIMALKRRRRKRLKYEAEVVVGRELERLRATGYHVYHDFPADQFNIDHIVVGTKGVFVVETIARANAGPVKKNGSALTVEYNGHVLFYPDGKDLNIVEKAQQQADWLSDWLGRAVGQPIATRSIVALPGWTVKRTSANGIPVVNPNQFASLFEHIQPRHLSDHTLARIVQQLDHKCAKASPANPFGVPDREPMVHGA
jgi:hypothetical protein